MISGSNDISGIVKINRSAIPIAIALVRKTNFKPPSRSDAVFCAHPKIAGEAAMPII